MANDLMVRIDANTTGYDAAIARAERQTHSFEYALRRAAAAQKQQEAALVKQNAALDKTGRAMGLFGLAAGVAFGVAVKAAADFEAKMAQVNSLLPHAERDLVPALAEATKGFADLGISATEAADAEIELVKAGVSAHDILGGALKGTLVLAAAGMIDVGEATQIASSAMTQFGLSGKDVPHIADLLAAAADKSLGGVSDLGVALGQAGTTAHQFGFSIEETTGLLAEFAAAGLIGEKGGATLKQMFLQLAAPTAKAQELMDQYGISLYNANGSTKSGVELAANLQEAFKGVSPEIKNAALATIFGSRAIQGANILLADGPKVAQKWADGVRDAGFATEQAAGKMDSLNGDLEKLGASFSNMLVDLGESGQGPLRGVVQSLTGLVDAIDGLPGPLKSGGLALLAFFAIVGTGAFALIKLRSGLIATKENLATLGVSAKNASKYLTFANAAKGAAVIGGLAIAQSGLADKTGLSNTMSLALMGTIAGPWGAAIGGGIGLAQDFAAVNNDVKAAMAAVNKVAKESPLDFEARKKALEGLTAATDDLRAKSVGLDVAGQSGAAGIGVLGFAAKAFKGDADDASDAASDFAAETMALQQGVAEFMLAANGGGLSSFSTNIDDIGQAAGTIVPALTDAGYSIKQIQDVLLTHKGWDSAVDVVKAYVNAQDSVPGRTKAVGDAVSGMGDQMQTAADKAKGLEEALDNLLGPELGLVAATDATTSAIRHLVDDLAKHNDALKGNTDAAIKNRAAINDRVQLISEQLVAEARAGVGAAKLTRDLKDQRDALVKAGVAAGLSGKELRSYLYELGLTPKLVNTLIKNNAPDAEHAARSLVDRYNSIPKDIRTKVEADGVSANATVDSLMQKYDGLTRADATTIIKARDAASPVIDGIQAKLAGLKNKDILITIRQNTINTVTDRHLTSNHAAGGYITGPGTGTSDSIPAYLSNGEFIVNAAATRRNLPLLHSINAQRFAGGGQVGGSFTMADLLRMVSKPDHLATLGEVATDRKAALAELRDVRRAERELKAARSASKNATQRVNETERQLEKARNAEKVDKAEVYRLNQRLRHQQYEAKQADKDATRAENDLAKQRDELTKATDKQKEATQALIEQSKAYASSVLAIGSAFGGSGTSVTAQGLLSKLKSSTSSAKDFQHDLKVLSRAHLNGDIMRQLREEGPTEQGLALASSLASHPGLIKRINAQQSAFDRIATSIGTFGQAPRHHGNGNGRDNGRRVEVNLNGPIHTYDAHEAARAIRHDQERALLMAKLS